jgi:hypothetical protein
MNQKMVTSAFVLCQLLAENHLIENEDVVLTVRTIQLNRVPVHELSDDIVDSEVVFCRLLTAHVLCVPIVFELVVIPVILEVR